MRLEGVITCVDYDDFLAETLPLNRSMFDHLVVVTSPDDKATQKLCEHWHVKCIETDAFGAKGQFCKGAGVNEGLKHLKMDGWVLHFDADVVLPPQTRSLLDKILLNPQMIYGVDRFNFTGYKVWRKHLRHPKLVHECGTYIHTGNHALATRFMWPDANGYLPIGFFQLWNPKESQIYDYPTAHTTAARTDMLFAKRWLRDKRGFLPEIIVYHLESEKTPQGVNWSGRTTIRYEATGIIAWLKRLWHKIKRWWWNLWHDDPPNPYFERSNQKEE